LHDGELAGKASENQAVIEHEAIACRAATRLFKGRTRHELLAAFREAIAQFAGRDPPENLVFDLTAGKRVMNLALYDAAPPGSHIVCFQAAFAAGRPVPYTEVVHPWRK